MTRRAAPPRSAGSPLRRDAAVLPPGCSTCATPATLPATREKSWATPHSPFTSTALMPTELTTPVLPEGAGGILLPVARAAIAAKVGVEHPPTADAEWLRATAACFVTLMRDA